MPRQELSIRTEYGVHYYQLRTGTHKWWVYLGSNNISGLEASGGAGVAELVAVGPRSFPLSMRCRAS